ncbi:MAG: hypothetical protein ACMXYE_02425 [Candidatus Woesearchaeota archaeon]
MISELLYRTIEIWSAFLADPIIYFPLLGSWIITVSYFIINHDEKHGHTYVMSTGIAHIFTAYIISPLAVPDIAWNFSDLRIIVVGLLFVYGCVLVIFGITRSVPDFLAEFFGDPGHALIPSLMAILYIHNSIAFDWFTFTVVATPVFILSGIKLYRRIKH